MKYENCIFIFFITISSGYILKNCWTNYYYYHGLYLYNLYNNYRQTIKNIQYITGKLKNCSVKVLALIEQFHSKVSLYHCCGLICLSLCKSISGSARMSACVCVRLRASACVCVRLRASACVCVRLRASASRCIRVSAYLWLCPSLELSL